MHKDSLTYNINKIPLDFRSYFKDFVGKQDEVNEHFLHHPYPHCKIISKTDLAIIKQIRIDTIEETQVFKSHNFRNDNFISHERNIDNQNISTAIVLLGLIFFAFAQVFSARKVYTIVKSAISVRAFFLFLKEGNVLNSRINLWLYPLYLLMLTLVLMQYLKESSIVNFEATNWIKLFGISVLGIILYQIVRLVIHLFLSFIFEIKKTIRIIRANILCVQLFLGLIFLPLTIAALFSGINELVYFNIGILLIFSFFRFIRSIYLAKTTLNFSLFHIILYFCISEIVPLIIMLKIAINSGIS